MRHRPASKLLRSIRPGQSKRHSEDSVYLKGKLAGLSRLSERVAVPTFSVLRAEVFDRFIAEAGLKNVYHDYWTLALDCKDKEMLEGVRRDLLELFVAAPFHKKTIDELEQLYREMPNCHCVVRSSATVEDSETASWAGQFISLFGIRTFEDWINAVRHCWASVATRSVMQYRLRVVPHSDPPRMALILQRAIDSIASGVVFSTDPSCESGGPVLEATVGLGLPLVGARVIPERWSMSPEGEPTLVGNHVGGLVKLLSADYPEKPGQSVSVRTPASSLAEVRWNSEPPEDGLWSGYLVLNGRPALQVLDSKLAKHLLSQAQTLAEHEGRACEMEFCVENTGKVYWLQIRPITQRHLEPKKARNPLGGSVIAQGVPVSGGVVNGIGFWHPLGRPNETAHTILFKDYTEPADVPLLLDVDALVTREGGLLCHSAIVCREIGLPCIVGARPFPPEISVQAKQLTLDADVGEIRSTRSNVNIQQASTCPKLPHPVPAPPVSHRIQWSVPRSFLARIAPDTHRLLHRISTLPGVISEVEVLPDVKLRRGLEGLGFPIGITFVGERLFPTAVTDLGDGFRIATIEGVTVEEVMSTRYCILAELRQQLADPGPKLQRELGGIDIRLLFEKGLAALDDSPFRECLSNRVEFQGVVHGGSPAHLSADEIVFAKRCLGWHGESGHFLEFLAPCSKSRGSLAKESEPLLVFHTGGIDFGIKIFNRFYHTGLSAAGNEGIYDPALMREGLWGVSLTRPTGKALLCTSLGILNYAFARRAVLQQLVSRALSRALGRDVSLRLVSDIVHTALTIEDGGLRHRQGVQAVRPLPTNVPLFLAGSPGTTSYIVTPKVVTNVRWAPHGKIEVPACKQDSNEWSLSPSREEVLIDGLLDRDWCEEKEAEAQVRECIDILQSLGAIEHAEPVIPLLCMRGARNGSPKIRDSLS